MMSGIKGKDTRPEMLIRRALHAHGYRYRLHDKKLPGKPDLVFRHYHAVIFIHGCFWHGHDCHLFKWPSTRAEFWRQKIQRNQEKDADNQHALKARGWRVLVVWECTLKGREKRRITETVAEVSAWLRSQKDFGEITGDTGDGAS